MDIGSLSPVAAVWPVSTTARGTETGTAMTTAGNDGGTAANTASGGGGAVAAASAAPPRQPDPDTPTGPPPAFSTTPLELDGYLQILLARLNATGYGEVQALAAEKVDRVAPKLGTEAATRSEQVDSPVSAGVEGARATRPQGSISVSPSQGQPPTGR